MQELVETVHALQTGVGIGLRRMGVVGAPPAPEVHIGIIGISALLPGRCVLVVGRRLPIYGSRALQGSGRLYEGAVAGDVFPEEELLGVRTVPYGRKEGAVGLQGTDAAVTEKGGAVRGRLGEGLSLIHI